jgi:hypothetical protein
MKRFKFFGRVLIALLAVVAELFAQTKIIDNGPDAGKLIIAVLGDGYATADQAQYNTDVGNLIVNGVFGNDFFRESHNAFNVYRVNLVSAESGVSQRRYDEKGTPDPSDDTIISTTMKNTALKFIFSGSWSHCWMEYSADTPTLLQNALNTYVPNYNYVVVILNENGFGGCGGGGHQYVTRSVGWDVVAHEYGHGVGGLWDEYTVAGAWTGGTANNRNCSTVLNRSTVFWNRYVNPSTPVPTTFAAGMDPNRTVGEFEGCGTLISGIYRPVHNCRMNGNSPPFCPVCHTLMKKALYPNLQHNFANAYVGDFNGDKRSDVLIHNGQDIAIYRTNPTSYTLDLVWIANNIVPAAPGGITWQPWSNDVYHIGDFDGDGRDDVFVFNGTDWVMPYLGLLRSDGTGLQGVARYDNVIPGFWSMKAGDKFFAGDFNADNKADLFIFNGTNWSMPYLGLLQSTGTSLTGTTRHDGTIPGWSMKPFDQFFVGDFDGDRRSDLYVFNGKDWSYKYLGMLKSSGSALSNIKLFTTSLPGWSMAANDQIFAGDFNRDGRADLYVFNGTDWAYAYLLMTRSTGTDLSFVRRYDSSSGTANIPGWYMTKGDRFYISDANKDGRADLFVYNPAINWATEYLGTLMSSGTALSGSWSADWVGGWNLGIVDKILVSRYEGGTGWPDLFIRNNEWFGLLRRASTGFVMDRIYYHWIYTALYDSKPWSDSMP